MPRFVQYQPGPGDTPEAHDSAPEIGFAPRRGLQRAARSWALGSTKAVQDVLFRVGRQQFYPFVSTVHCHVGNAIFPRQAPFHCTGKALG